MRAEKGFEELGHALARKRVKPQLPVMRSALPAVLVFGPVAREQQDARLACGGDELVEQAERQRIAPMQILEHGDDGLCAALAQQQADHRLIGEQAMLQRIERAERVLAILRIEEVEDRRDRILQRGVEREDPIGHLVADRPRRVAGVDLEIALEQLDDGQIGRGVAVGGGARLQDQAAGAAG